MNHSFLIINDNKIIKLIEKLENNQKINILERIKIKRWCLFQLSNKEETKIKHDIFILLNPSTFNSYCGSLKKLSKGYNCYGYTIIPNSSIEIAINEFKSISNEELNRLKDINIDKEEYESIIKPIIELLSKAKVENKSVLHLGI